MKEKMEEKKNPDEANESTEISEAELQVVLERVRGQMDAADFEILSKIISSYLTVLGLLKQKGVSIKRLLKLVFGSKSEKMSRVFKKELDAEQKKRAGENGGKEKKEKKEKPKGHGKNGAKDYTGAKKVRVAHPTLKAGSPCPECPKGKVYPMGKPAALVRVTGQAPINATVYELERLRCNLCGKIFQAPLPAGVEYTKYDHSAASMMANLKYGNGFPFHRLEKFQRNIGIPLPASTQWNILKERYLDVEPAYKELIRQAAQGKVLHNDDTRMRIHELTKARQEAGDEEGTKRKGCFTTGIVSLSHELRIAVFFTGEKHAGENLQDVLEQRAAELEPPVQMCDALSCNVPATVKTILANCNAHARRQFVDIASDFPEECQQILQTFSVIYLNDEHSKKEGMSDLERLAYHQTHSQQPMDQLHTWATENMTEKKIEPNSDLGKAVKYLLKHWAKLTLFLRVADAPLDNNIVERALKRAIMHRKNSLFYRSLKGAYVGDTFMSLIYSAELAGENPVDYLTQLLCHHRHLAEAPADWLPWNYRSTMERLGLSRQPPIEDTPS